MPSLYDRFVLPRVVHFTCSRRPNMRQRAKLVPRAEGRVLEIGFGSGLNLSYYDRARVERIWALEPAPEMWRLAAPAVREAGLPVELLPAPAEAIPLADASADTALVTYTLCTVTDVGRVLAEVRRVLRPGGALLFCEHGAAPDPGTRRWQDRLNPLWKRLGGGCNLNRDLPALLAAGGFAVADLETIYLPGWRPASFNFWGSATPR